MNTAEQREREHEQAHPEQYHRGFHLIAWTCLQTGETGFDVYELGHGSLCEHPTREAAVACGWSVSWQSSWPYRGVVIFVQKVVPINPIRGHRLFPWFHRYSP